MTSAWPIYSSGSGPKRRSCIVSLVTSQPRDLAFYRTAILDAHDDLSHVTVEIQHCDHARAA
jgi:hypothetical protein